MDPNACLEGLRANMRKLYNTKDMTMYDVEPILDDIVGEFKALDEWLTRGGFPPAAWASRFAGPEVDAYTDYLRGIESKTLLEWLEIPEGEGELNFSTKNLVISVLKEWLS